MNVARTMEYDPSGSFQQNVVFKNLFLYVLTLILRILAALWMHFYAILRGVYSRWDRLMRYINWLLRLLVFFILIGFTVKNDQPVTLRYFLGFAWESSLIIVLFTFFAAGAAVAALAMLSIVLTQRRNIARLERDVRVKHKLAELDDTPTTSTSLS